MASDVEQGLRANPEVDAPVKSCFWIKRRSGPIPDRSNVTVTPNTKTSSSVSNGRIMATSAGILLALLLATVGVSAWAISSDAERNNRVSSEEGDIESRSDYPDFDDLNSFFDFELGPSRESEREYQSNYQTPESSSGSTDGRPRRNKYYYYYKSDGPRYPESHYHPYPPKKQVVTPGTHYQPQDEKDVVAENTSVSEAKPTLHQAVVGPYQVSVVDADSPVLSSLGLNKDDLQKLSGYTKRSTPNASMVGSDSIASATYAENPRQDYPQSNYAPTHSHPQSNYAPTHSHPPPSNNQQYDAHYGHTERNYRPSEYYPADNSPPNRGYSPSSSPAQPPPQGSYDGKGYMASQNSPPYSPPSYNYPPPSPGYNQYSPPAPSYAPKRSSEVPWRQTSTVHTDWDDKQNKKPEPYHAHNPYPPPSSHSSTPSNSVSHYPRPVYSSSEKPGYRYAPYSKPQTPPKSTYSATSSSEYHSHKPSYYSSSSSKPAPSRTGSVSYSSPQHHQEASKPGITIRFKAKSPGHGSGLSIPVNFNPLDVVKKLLPPLSSLNPLNNKKVTIGITIENKKEPHHDYHSY